MPSGVRCDSVGPPYWRRQGSLRLGGGVVTETGYTCTGGLVGHKHVIQHGYEGLRVNGHGAPSHAQWEVSAVMTETGGGFC